jgi:hypothetical protein
MAREQTQDLPTRGIRPANVQAGQYRVAVQQAPESKLMGLARGLSSVNRGLEAYAGIAEIHRELGEERGALEAAQADLAQATKELDRAGQSLVDQGIMPKSHLRGFQQAYQENIGKRHVRTYMSQLNERWNEITNPEASDDIIDRVLTEERQKVLDNFGENKQAILGFVKHAENFDLNFVNKAVAARDRRVQAYNKSLIIEDLNNNFSPLLQSKDTDLGAVTQQIKGELDQMVEAGSVDRSEAVELFWNGVAIPTISELATTNPDRAEILLDSILDIDLTGRGGRLGNINREGAYIKSKSIDLQNRIDRERERIEALSPELGDRILNDYRSASMAVYSGLLPEDDPNYQEDLEEKGREVVRALSASGMPIEEAEQVALTLLRSQDIDSLLFYMSSGYTANENTRTAFLDELDNMRRFTTMMAQQATLVVPKEEADAYVQQFTSILDDGVEVNAIQFAAANQITDPRLKAQLRKAELDYERINWYVNSDEHENRLPAIREMMKNTLNEIQESNEVDLVFENKSDLQTAYYPDDLVAEYEQEYTQSMREASSGTTNTEEFKQAGKLHNQQLQTLQSRFENWVETKSATIRSRTDREQDLTVPQIVPSKQARDNLKAFTQSSGDLFSRSVIMRESLGYSEFHTGFDPGRVGEKPTELGQLLNNFQEVANLPLASARPAAIRYVDGLLAAKRDNLITKEAMPLLETHLKDLRAVYGFSTLDEATIVEGQKYMLSVPYFVDATQLRSFGEQAKAELERYQSAGASIREIRAYPALEELLQKFNLSPTNEDLSLFYTNQYRKLQQ